MKEFILTMGVISVILWISYLRAALQSLRIEHAAAKEALARVEQADREKFATIRALLDTRDVSKRGEPDDQ